MKKLCLIVIFLSILKISLCQKKTYEINQLGLIDESNEYLSDGGAGQFKIKFKKIISKGKKVKIEGCLLDYHMNIPIYSYTIFIGVNNKKNKKLEVIDTLISTKKHEVNDDCSKKDDDYLQGRFDIKIKLDSNQNIYFESIGYSVMELKIIPLDQRSK